MASPSSGFGLNSDFLTFESFKNALKQWEKENSVNLYTRSSRTIAGSSYRHSANRHFSPDLKYFSIEYACVHGGRPYKPNLRDGSRPNQS
jgi:hypothetical protein